MEEMSENENRRLVPIKLEKGFKRIKVKPYSDYEELTGISGKNIKELLKETEEKGFLTLPRYHDSKYSYFKNTYLERCRKNNQLYVEVLIDDKWNRAFACFDTITLNPNELYEFNINDLVLNTELQAYYEKLSEIEKKRLYLPAGFNPYRNSRNKTNYFILPKQICFGFYLKQPEIFYYALKKFRLKR